MKNLSILLISCFFAIGSANYTALSYTDRECGSDVSNLWLDVVAVVDTSAHMTNAALNQVAANILSVFSSGTRIGTDPSEPRTTRVGLVTYNSNATVADDLDKFQSLDDLYIGIYSGLNGVSQTNESDLSAGLLTAAKVLQRNTTRLNYRKVIIVYTDYFDPNSNAEHVASSLRSSGFIIIPVGLNLGRNPDLQKYLTMIASNGMNFTMNKDNLVEEIQQELAYANCFCPDAWHQYTINNHRYGVCILPVNLIAVWRAASISCKLRYNNAYMLNEYNQQKHDFVWNMVQNTLGFVEPIVYHTGLFISNGKWVWDQPKGWPNPPLQNWTNWDGGVPVPSSTTIAVANIQTGNLALWKNMATLNSGAQYVCEVATCDTDNYCEYNAKE